MCRLFSDEPIPVNKYGLPEPSQILEGPGVASISSGSLSVPHTTVTSAPAGAPAGAPAESPAGAPAESPADAATKDSSQPSSCGEKQAEAAKDVLPQKSSLAATAENKKERSPAMPKKQIKFANFEKEEDRGKSSPNPGRKSPNPGRHAPSNPKDEDEHGAVGGVDKKKSKDKDKAQKL